MGHFYRILAISMALLRPLSAGSTELSQVRIKTEFGDIVVQLEDKRVPITTANFLRYVDGKFYDQGAFVRTVTPLNQSDSPIKLEVVQADINPKRLPESFAPILLETTEQSGIKHARGVLSMARDAAANSAHHEFFICLRAEPELDFGGKGGAERKGYAAFGHVVEGLEVIRRIHEAKAEVQRLNPPILIISIRRE